MDGLEGTLAGCFPNRQSIVVGVYVAFVVAVRVTLLVLLALLGAGRLAKPDLTIVAGLTVDIADTRLAGVAIVSAWTGRIVVRVAG